MKSVKDSVHRLLSDQIVALNLQSFYDVQQGTIRGRNGTEFFFEGLRHNAQQIKSYEGIDRCWVEEAVTVSKSSWNFLIPTIRKEGSEIWVSFNPELEEDETYQRFVVHPPTGAVVIKMNWRDNPWFTDVLRQEMVDLKARDENDYQTVWEGNCRQAVEGAIYAREIRVAQEDGRITRVPYDRAHPVHTFWDIGFGDLTSIWFVQKIGFNYYVIDYLEDRQKLAQDYVAALQAKGYVYGTDHLPWDGRSKSLAGSVEDKLITLGRRVGVAPQLTKADGIDAVRALFPACYFDAEKCADGISGLRRYRYAIDVDTGKISKEPHHDMYSHPADALRTFATIRDVQWNIHVERPAVENQAHGKVLVDFDPMKEMHR